MNAAEIRDAILSGAADGKTDMIYDAIKRRRAALASELRHELSPGDEVRIQGLRPAYINGLHAEVVKVKQTRADVRIIDAHRVAAKRFGHGTVTAPLTALVPVGGSA